MNNIDNTDIPVLRTPISFFRDSESVKIINKALLSHQASLKLIITNAFYSNNKTEDEDMIKHTIKKIDDILDTIELYSS
jgi:hypothetical protein